MLEINGFLYGYFYYSPRLDRINETFNVAFGTYVNGKWFLAEFYLNTTYEPNPPIVEKIIDGKMADLNFLV